MTTEFHRRTAPSSGSDIRVARLLPIALGLAVVLGACGGGGGGGDGGNGAAAGSDLRLRGTVPDNRRLASRQLEVRAASGERSVATIEADGRFSVETLAGTGPWLLKAAFGTDDAWYAIAHGTDAIVNVHAYTDLALRNVLAQAGQSVETLFEEEGVLSADALPEADEIGAVNGVIADVLAPSLEAYGFAGIGLASAAFVADGDGLDAFLTNNPALVEDDAFTILATDPDTDTVTTIADAVPIGQDLLAVDGTAPGAPSNVRALPAASNEIVLVWEAARDNVAIARYEVRRDDVVVDTTPYPVYSDIPLETGVVYDYAVIAIDAAGNRSVATPTVSAETLAAPDTEAPPAPSALEVTATRASARLRWTQAGVSDVAAFRVYRGEDGGMLGLRSRVTATATTDVDLAVATPYCYEVTAVDASDNESARGERVCATTGGSAAVPPPRVTPVAPTPAPEPDSGPTPGPTPSAPGAIDAGLEALLAVDVTNTPCEAELDVSIVDGAVTLDRPCYRLPDGLTVRENGQLTIAAGTVLKFGSGDTLDVQTGGSLTARGTASAPIVFSAIDPTPGFWRGVRFSRSNSTRNVLENVVIEYAGGGGLAALEVLSSGSSVTRLAVDGAVLRRSADKGFRVAADSFRGMLNRLVSTGNSAPGTIGPESAGLLGAGSRFSGNAVDELRLFDGSDTSDIDAATVWPSIDVPWSVDGLNVDAPLEMPPGTTVRFLSGGSLRVGEAGSLRAIGTAAAPILFTGTDPTPGFWDGVRFYFTNSSDNRLEHVTVEYGGGVGALDGGIVTQSFASNETRLALSDVTSRFNDGPGFRFQVGTRLAAFERVTSTGNDRTGVIHPDALPSLGGGLSLSGNTDDVVSLYDADIVSAVTWPALEVPYTFTSLDVEGALTLSPGTTLLANPDALITVDSSGSLNAVGTAAAPIVIVGRNPVPGHWDGLYYSTSDSPRNRLEHVELRHAGGGGASATRGNVTMVCFASSPGRLSIANSVIADGTGWGVYRRPGEGCTVNLGANVTFTNTAQGTVSPF